MGNKLDGAESARILYGNGGVMSEKSLLQIMHDIQSRLSVPKTRRNTFGNYNYRNAEDIVDAIKKLLPEGVVLKLSDDIVNLGGRFYVKATAQILFNDKEMSCNGWARESDEKKGMDAAQITGAASSYARKYALNGLFAIDDGIDADLTNEAPKVPKAPKVPDAPKEISPEEACRNAQTFVDGIKKKIGAAKTLIDIDDVLIANKNSLDRVHAKYADISKDLQAAINTREDEINIGL